VAGVILTNGDLDHCLGLLSLREWTPFSIYATGETHHGLVEYNAMLRTLQRQSPHAVLRQLVLDQTSPVLDALGQQSGLSVRAFASPGNVPLHLRHLMSPSLESNVGLVIEAAETGGKIAYVPAAGSLENLKSHVAGVDCLFFDGTFWHDEELVELGLSGKTAAALAHVPISGSRGSLQLLRSLPIKRCVYVHINNTNPVLRDAGAERKMVEASGIAIAEDGMEFRL
jgi:pyrroloquinoline quinone biosynthesis protein B